VRSKHYAEAKAALAFQMGASVGAYQMYVGAPYQVSVVRYFGDGTEQSDSNMNGPNIEFDGFGLFLWSLDQYVRASGDMASLAAWWPVVGGKVADVLVGLQEPTGLIAPDSSIWEVHWNGNQRHFGYTTITAANGLCAASHLATQANDATRSATYLGAGTKARDALLTNLRAPDGTLAQSVEALAGGKGWLDASEVEAINLGLIYPDRRTARATLTSMQVGLVPQSGRGFMRDDLGPYYDSQEWIFVDLRTTRALELHGDTTDSASLFGWNVDQATENFGEFSELHDAVTADYAGASPMVGFGAGAYLVALSDRGTPGTPTCGAYADEPADPVDGGPASDGGGMADASGGPGRSGDGGSDGGTRLGETPGSGSKGCGCEVYRSSSSGLGLLGALGLLCAALARRVMARVRRTP
jgi:GH15 family glucan-1,4-alpha-glucosidase